MSRSSSGPKTTGHARGRTSPGLRIVVAWLVLGLLVGCGAATRQKILSVLFDGVVQDTAPPRRRVRRDLLHEIEELKRELARVQEGAVAPTDESAAVEEAVLPVEQVTSWSEAADLLPEGADGEVDWEEALRDGTISPRAGPGPGAAVQPVFPMDVERLPAAGDMFRVVFPHEAHTAWLACPSCHPALFQMQKGATPMSMEQINAGELCGFCHGKVAFPPTACGRCHPAMAAAPAAPVSADQDDASAGAVLPVERAASWEEAADLLPKDADGNVDWTQALRDGTIAPRAGVDPEAAEESRLPLDVERIPAMGEAFKVVFSHEVHTTWLTCPSCHPAPFQMQKGATPMSMEQINAGELCGVCHGKVAFPATTCARCHPGLA